MDPHTLAPLGAFAVTGALIPVAPETGLIPGDGLIARQPAPQNPAEVLANLMDFPGSVALADLLQGGLPPVPAHPDADSLGDRLLLDAQARLDTLEPLVLKPLTGRRSPEVPAPHELLHTLLRHGLANDRSEQVARRIADELGAPFRSALGLSLRQAQAHVATLRWEITHDLRNLGPRADQLERLDAALSRAMQGKIGELLDRMEHAAHLTFVRACLHAVAALPDTLDEACRAHWSTDDGWLGRYRERCVRMAKALFGHLRRSLEGLMRAATLSEDS
jgi:hypothetical protein